MHLNIHKRSSQKGVALLTFALIILIGSAYLLTKKLNANTSRFDVGQVSNNALNLAKDALIGWSVFHPDNPGILLFPDRNGDGNYDGKSDCTSSTVNNNLLLGKLPWYGQGTPCISPQTGLDIFVEDFYGEQLWYAVSSNLLYESPNYPFVSPALLYETNNWITVRDQNGNVLSDRVAFVVISPGNELDSQDRSAAAPDVSNYLDSVTIGETTYSNADYDQDFIIYPNSESTDDTTDSFNDQLIFVTIDEFMQRVEKRALNELGNILTAYHDDNNAFTWLSPFTDPKVNRSNISGKADSGSSSTLLIDSNQDFIELGVKQDDIVYNVTDGSVGVIASDPSLTDRLSVSNLVLGTDNDFDNNDEYQIFSKVIQSTLSGTATTNSIGTTLEDNTKDFTELNISFGDVIENIDDGSVGIIASVTTNEIEVDSLTGGTENDFDSGEAYLIKTNFGVVSSSGTTTLQDTNKDFDDMGVQAGDLIWNTTDESIGRVSSVAGNTITVDQLFFGSDNQFDSNDTYTIPKFNTVTQTRKGQLSFHEVGELFPTDIDLDWTITVDSGDVSFDTSTFPGVDSTYQTALVDHVKQYAASGTESFISDDNNSSCVWSIPEVADCFGYFDDFLNISGNLTSGNNTSLITDSAADFSTDGIKRGDIAQNYDDETSVASGTVDAANSGTATTDSDSNGLTLEDTNNNFLNINISVGEIIYNTTDGSSGIITAIAANQITVASLSGGTNDIFSSGDDYQIGTVPVLYDASADFSSYEPYSYLVQNNTLEGELGETKIQGIISDIVTTDTLEAEAYVGEESEPIQFRPGDSYQIYQPRQFVVETINSDTKLTTDNYLDSTDPDFDDGEYYRIVPAAKSVTATVDSVNGWWPDILQDDSATFVTDGVEVGDIVENHAGAFGEITAVTETTITTYLREGWSNSFSAGSSYTIYYDYVYSRRHEWHVRIRGNEATNTVSNIRKRDVCIGYNSDCSSTSSTSFSDNNIATTLTVHDFQEDRTTEVGRATFTPSSASSGSFKVSNIEYYLAVTADDIPEWFIRNKWYQYFYIAYSSGGDIPYDTSPCTAGTDCLALNIDIPNDSPNVTTQNDIRALLIYSGEELTDQPQSQSSGLISAYFEGDPEVDSLENTDGDDDFDKVNIQYNSSGEPINFNDRIRIAISCPSSTDICWQ